MITHPRTTQNDIVEIKSFPKPPALVQMTMEAVCILKQEKPDWDTAKKLLSDSNFMRSLEEFDKDNIPVRPCILRCFDDVELGALTGIAATGKDVSGL